MPLPSEIQNNLISFISYNTPAFTNTRILNKEKIFIDTAYILSLCQIPRTRGQNLRNPPCRNSYSDLLKSIPKPKAEPEHGEPNAESSLRVNKQAAKWGWAQIFPKVGLPYPTHKKKRKRPVTLYSIGIFHVITRCCLWIWVCRGN